MGAQLEKSNDALDSIGLTFGWKTELFCKNLETWQVPAVSRTRCWKLFLLGPKKFPRSEIAKNKWQKMNHQSRDMKLNSWPVLSYLHPLTLFHALSYSFTHTRSLYHTQGKHSRTPYPSKSPDQTLLTSKEFELVKRKECEIQWSGYCWFSLRFFSKCLNLTLVPVSWHFQLLRAPPPPFQIIPYNEQGLIWQIGQKNRSYSLFGFDSIQAIPFSIAKKKKKVL